MSGNVRFNLVYVQWTPASGSPEFSWDDVYPDRVDANGDHQTYRTWGYRAAADAKAWWAARYNNHFSASRPAGASLTFSIYEYTGNYVPADPARGSDGLAIRAALTQICPSCPSTVDPDHDVEAFNDGTISAANHAFTSFLFLNPQIGDHPPPETFGPGRSAGYASAIGGSYSQVRLFPDGGYGRTPSLFAHETGHLFFACDEYPSSNCGCGSCESNDHLNQFPRNGNCRASDCSFSGGLYADHRHECIMSLDYLAYAKASEYERVCEFTRQSIAWWKPPCFVDSAWDTTAYGPAQWKAEYFADLYAPRMPLVHWAGAPLWTRPLATEFIHDDFSNGIGPVTNCQSTAITSYYSIRYRKKAAFQTASYTFTANTSEGFRLYVDDQLRLSSDAAGEQSVTLPMQAGSYEVRFDYYNSAAAGHAYLSWAGGCLVPPSATISGNEKVCPNQTAPIHIEVSGGTGSGPWNLTLARNDGVEQSFSVTATSSNVSVPYAPAVKTYAVKLIEDTVSHCAGGGTGLATVAPQASPSFNGLTAHMASSGCAVVLTWNPATNSCSGGFGYKILRNPTGGELACVSTTSYTDSTVVNGVHYDYTVLAGDGGCQAVTFIGQTQSITASCSAPAAPQSLTATVSASTVVLTWPAVAGASAYSVERRSAASGGWIAMGYPSASTFTDASVANGLAYAYRVRAYNGVYSDPVAAVATLMSFTPVSSSVICPVAFAETLSAINAIRAVSGMPALTWGDILQGSPAPSAPASGARVVGEHVLALRRAMDVALGAVGVWPVPYSDAVLPGSPLTTIKGVHLVELQWRARQ